MLQFTGIFKVAHFAFQNGLFRVSKQIVLKLKMGDFEMILCLP